MDEDAGQTDQPTLRGLSSEHQQGVTSAAQVERFDVCALMDVNYTSDKLFVCLFIFGF